MDDLDLALLSMHKAEQDLIVHLHSFNPDDPDHTTYLGKERLLLGALQEREERYSIELARRMDKIFWVLLRQEVIEQEADNVYQR